MKDKRELVRIVKSPEGDISVDFTGKASGRGAYICKSVQCLETAVKNKGLNRAFKEPVPEEILQKLSQEIDDE
jgi:hypothetical protein